MQQNGFEIGDIFPNFNIGLSNIGFLFGAGTSSVAGYPLMPRLTTDVLKELTDRELNLLKQLVKESLGQTIDLTRGEPNIEIITDILEDRILVSQKTSPQYDLMISAKSKIRDNIIETLQRIQNPDLKYHIRFFKAINRLFAGRSDPVWIFTPNYDLLFEVAASLEKLPLCDGFNGSSLRFLDVNCLTHQTGVTNGRRFEPIRKPVIRLVKLHGSLDWWEKDSSYYSTQDPRQLPGTPNRVIILPRKKKITDTLESPFDELFRIASKSIGTECKYMVTCGYAFGDQHINETLILPKIQQSKMQLTAFVKEENPYLVKLAEFPSFVFGTEKTSKKRTTNIEPVGTQLWQFEKFVDFIAAAAGV